MTVKEAAKSLGRQLSQFPWYVTIGWGMRDSGETILVCVETTEPAELDPVRHTYKEYPTIIMLSGRLPTRPRPEDSDPPVSD
jgi:hypothetical protein